MTQEVESITLDEQGSLMFRYRGCEAVHGYDIARDAWMVTIKGAEQPNTFFAQNAKEGAELFKRWVDRDRDAPIDPPARWPREGEFMPDRPLAEAVTVQIAAVTQLMTWCGNFRAQPRLRNALDQLEIARDLLRTERHR